ncbi:MAG: PHP domain-containing protein [Phascolarctobacterium sp.]|nr:PHP domain-containing protein [Phascolarctobacterium sp.]
MLVDLHIHSTFSDGLYTPAQLVSEAESKNVRVISVTDHDLWEGVAPALLAAEGTKVKVIAGVELGTQFDGASIHILGYHVDTGCTLLHDKMVDLRKAREERLLKILKKLNLLGYEVTAGECDPINRAVGRPHVAKALVAKGYFSTVQEAFDVLLRRGGPAYVAQPRLNPEEAIKLIHSAKGIAVLAHPNELPNVDFAEMLITKFPFDGLEVYHPSADEESQKHWLQFARKKNILISGGSDFHGISDRYPESLGIFQVHYSNTAGVINYAWK